MRLEYLCKNKYSRGASQAVQLVRNLPANAGDIGSLGWEDSLEKEMVTHFLYSCQRNPLDRGAWWAAVHGITKSWTRLSMHVLSLSTQGCDMMPWRLPPSKLQCVYMVFVVWQIEELSLNLCSD